MFSTLASWLRTAHSRKCIYVIFIIRSKLQGGFPDHGSRCGNRRPRWNRCYGGVVGKTAPTSVHQTVSTSLYQTVAAIVDIIFNRIRIVVLNIIGFCIYININRIRISVLNNIGFCIYNLNINRIRISIFNSSGLCRYNFQPYPHRCIKHYRPLYI